MRAHLVILAAATAVAGSVAIAPAVQSQTATRTVGVTLKEFKLTPSVKSIPSGKVTFLAKNTGKLKHELAIVRTDKAPGRFPIKAGKAVVEEYGVVEDIAPGKTGRLTITMKRGKYVFLCNVPGHYKAGQYAAFTVR
jgi:uncharacterized cupredoxin-like copper-binding protein